MSVPPPPPGWKDPWPPDPPDHPAPSPARLAIATLAGLALGLGVTLALAGVLRFVEGTGSGAASIARMLHDGDPRISGVRNGAIVGLILCTLLLWWTVRLRLSAGIAMIVAGIAGFSMIQLAWSLGHLPLGLGAEPALPFLSPGDVPRHVFREQLLR